MQWDYAQKKLIDRESGWLRAQLFKKENKPKKKQMTAFARHMTSEEMLIELGKADWKEKMKAVFSLEDIKKARGRYDAYKKLLLQIHPLFSLPLVPSSREETAAAAGEKAATATKKAAAAEAKAAVPKKKGGRKKAPNTDIEDKPTGEEPPSDNEKCVSDNNPVLYFATLFQPSCPNSCCIKTKPPVDVKGVTESMANMAIC
ncbi:hypothetical protein PM082_004273 [Marasmius tenuissimus]|nr:hypothetical protein PM082_004273 [Marasmius tenuissimus]